MNNSNNRRFENRITGKDIIIPKPVYIFNNQKLDIEQNITYFEKMLNSLCLIC